MIRIKDLDCFKNSPAETRKNRLISPDRGFKVEDIKNKTLSNEISEFIYYRGKVLSLSSIRTELYQFNIFCKFINQECSDIESIRNINQELMLKKAKKWLMAQGKAYIQQRIKTECGKKVNCDCELIKYIKKIYRYLFPESNEFDKDADKWIVDSIPLEIRKNPTNAVKSISFSAIKQCGIKKEVQQIMYLHLMHKALGTVLAEITAINRFSNYLSRQYPFMETLTLCDRELIEGYLLYLNTEVTGKRSFSKELMHLKSIFITASKIYECKSLKYLFLADDISNNESPLYKVYMDDEIRRLNEAIVELDEQVARALILHQLLGTRISETLSLTQDALYENENGEFIIKIYQIKTNKIYEKKITDEMKRLFTKSCEYTYSKFGDRKYVFVNEKNPDLSMQYSRIKYQIMAMIRKNNLRDNNGDLFGVGTHIWRHCYGKKLTELHIDDATIAKLMGHSNTSSLRHYRKIGNEQMKKETKALRSTFDVMIQGIIEDWE